MIAREQPMPNAEPLECTHCGVEVTVLPGAASRYFCCPRCGRWQCAMYASEILRKHAGVRYARPEPARGPEFEKIKARMDAWVARLDRDDPAAVLGVSPRASNDQIRERYRELAMAHHPDRGGDASEMRRINEAYERLRARVR